MVINLSGFSKIPSVIAEVALGNCAVKIHDLVEDYKRTATGRKKIMPLLKKCYPGRYDDMDVEDFIELHNNSKLEDVYCFKVGCFSKYTPEVIQKLMDDLGVTMQSDVYMPETDLTDLEELKENLDPEEYQEVVKKMEGKFKKVEKPLMAGYVTIEQLYHIPSYSNKVTSDLVINSKKTEPISGRGRYRSEGQKILTSLFKNSLIAENWITMTSSKIIYIRKIQYRICDTNNKLKKKGYKLL